MKKFKLISYGKHFIIQDKVYEDDTQYLIKEITKNDAIDKEFIESHKSICDQYGTPSYIGKDKDLKKIYNK